MGVLGWTPGEFWAATPHDLHAALDGWLEANGRTDISGGLTGEDIERLRDFIDTGEARVIGHG